VPFKSDLWLFIMGLNPLMPTLGGTVGPRWQPLCWWGRKTLHNPILATLPSVGAVP